MEWLKTSATGGFLMIALLVSQHLSAASMASAMASDGAGAQKSKPTANTSCEWSRIGGKRLLHCDSGETLARLQHRATLMSHEAKAEKPKQFEPRQQKFVQPDKKKNDQRPPAQEKMMRLAKSIESKPDLELVKVEPETLTEVRAEITDTSGSELVKKEASVKPNDPVHFKAIEQDLAAVAKVSPELKLAPKLIVETQPQEKLAPNPMGFMIVGKGDVQRLMQILDDGAVHANEVEYIRLRKAPFENKVSFGIYSYKASAQAHCKELLTYGIDSVIVDRSSNLNDPIAKLD
ncbi:MAG: hypothetical protein ACJAVI_006069 [Candidatus Azotimanducaceae bacterium]|jgi:hypothetical protein